VQKLYESLPESVGKRRVHFHAFMIDIHKRLHKMAADAETTGITQKGDAIVPVARELARDGRVLCFDEFQVTDIADAMILRRLMESMIGYGFVIIITSK
jgi:protein AFG1